MKTSETKSRGRIEAFTTAGAASAFGMRVVTATPRQLKVAVPRRSVVRNDNAVLVGRDTSNRKDPIPVTMTTRRADIRVLCAILPNKNEKAGNGVPLILFRIPLSLEIVRFIAKPVYEEFITENAIIIGT
tara:strand:- start:1385 stop:1774 length:390 start_codon:yes stop_codon:yes gene_type:complete